jgi:osmotically-inducible protein OsmY
MHQLKLLVAGVAMAGSLAMVSGAGHAEQQSATITERAGDSATSTAVKSRLLWNHSTAGLDIEVTSEDGVVTLEGETESAEMRDLAERLTADTNSVRGVRNHLRVRSAGEQPAGLSAALPAGISAESLSDAWITGKVRSLLLVTQGLSGTDIKVETNEGHVELRGRVETAAKKQQTEESVRNVRGVRQVSTSALNIDS